MKRVSPALVTFLVHCGVCDGWLLCDPIKAKTSTLKNDEASGLATLEREKGTRAHPRIIAAALTEAGLAFVKPYLTAGEQRALAELKKEHAERAP